MAHAVDAAYFAKRAAQSRSAAIGAADVASRNAHEHLSAAYEARLQDATAASDASAGKPVLRLVEAASPPRGVGSEDGGLVLAAPISRYFDAETRRGGDATAACFSADARVHDDGRIHHGAAAIGKWSADEKAKTRYTVKPLAVSPHDGRTLVAAEVAGRFPGSPVTFWYAFTIANDRITDLDIRA